MATGRGLTPFRNFEREMEEFFGRRDAGLGPGHRHGGPVLRADLPGLEQKDVEVSVENNTLTVRGERKAEKETKDEDYYACERRTGAFFRSVTLPPGVDAEKVRASFRNGVLEVHVPKTNEARAKKIARPPARSGDNRPVTDP